MTTINELEFLKTVRPKINNILRTGEDLNSSLSVDESTLNVSIQDSSGDEKLRVKSLHADSANVETLKLNGGIVNVTASEINDIANWTIAIEKLNTVSNITASTSELNLMDSAQFTTEELNQLQDLDFSSLGKSLVAVDSSGAFRNLIGLGSLATTEVSNDTTLSGESPTKPPSENAYKAYIDSKQQFKEYLGHVSINGDGDAYFDFTQYNDSDYLYYEIVISNFRHDISNNFLCLAARASYNDSDETDVLTGNRYAHSHFSATSKYREIRLSVSTTTIGRLAPNDFHIKTVVKYFPHKTNDTNACFIVRTFQNEGPGNNGPIEAQHYGVWINETTQQPISHLLLYLLRPYSVEYQLDFDTLNSVENFRLYGIKRDL